MLLIDRFLCHTTVSPATIIRFFPIEYGSLQAEIVMLKHYSSAKDTQSKFEPSHTSGVTNADNWSFQEQPFRKCGCPHTNNGCPNM